MSGDEARPATALRTLRVGDRWEYTLSGHVERDGSRLPIEGRSTVDVERRDTERGELLALVFLRELRLVGVDGPEGDLSPPPGIFYAVQDADTLDVCVVGDNMGAGGGDRFAAEPQVFYPGRWSESTAYDNTLDFGAAGDVRNTLAVEDVTTVDAPFGRLAAWRAPIGSTSAQFGAVEGVDYWTPQLGAPIRFEMRVAGPDGAAMTTMALLSVARLVEP